MNCFKRVWKPYLTNVEIMHHHHHDHHLMSSFQKVDSTYQYASIYHYPPTLFFILIQPIPVVPWLTYSPLDQRFEGSNPTKVDGFFQSIEILDHLLGIVVSMSDCHPRGPEFDSQLYPRNFSGSIGSGTGSTEPREDNWVVT